MSELCYWCHAEDAKFINCSEPKCSNVTCKECIGVSFGPGHRCEDHLEPTENKCKLCDSTKVRQCIQCPNFICIQHRARNYYWRCQDCQAD